MQPPRTSEGQSAPVPPTTPSLFASSNAVRSANDNVKLLRKALTVFGVRVHAAISAAHRCTRHSTVSKQLNTAHVDPAWPHQRAEDTANDVKSTSVGFRTETSHNSSHTNRARATAHGATPFTGRSHSELTSNKRRSHMAGLRSTHMTVRQMSAVLAEYSMFTRDSQRDQERLCQQVTDADRHVLRTGKPFVFVLLRIAHVRLSL